MKRHQSTLIDMAVPRLITRRSQGTSQSSYTNDPTDPMKPVSLPSTVAGGPTDGPENGGETMILPVNYEVPPEVMAKLATGELQRFGSVVRDRTEIILHLKEVAAPLTEEGVAAALKAVVSRNPKTSLGVGVSLVAAGGAVLWSANKKRRGKNATAAIPTVVSAFTEALADYLEAVQSGNLDADIIERIISALDALDAESTSGSPTVEVSTDHLTALVTLVDDYTCQLARANDVELDEIEQPVADLSIVDLRRRLESQQQVFKEAA